MFSSLTVRDYRYFAMGNVASQVGTWMQRIAQDWLVLTVTDSPLALGFTAALQFGPTLLLSTFGGALADRRERRGLLLVLQACLGLSALLLGLLVLTGQVRLWQILVLALATGCASAIEAPTRTSFVSDLVGPANVANAVALNSMSFNAARIVGPALAGLLITGVGSGWVFMINAASFGAVAGGLLLVRTRSDPTAGGSERGLAYLRSGIRYVRNRPDLVIVLALLFFVSTFGLNLNVMLAVFSREVFGNRATSFTGLVSAMAVGTLTGALLAARRSAARSDGEPVRPRLRLLLVSGALFGLLEVAVGLSEHYGLAAVVLVVCGAAALTFTTAANAMVQISTPPQLRGRVMGLYFVVFLGGSPLGYPLMGWLGEAFGGRAPIVTGGAITMIAALSCGFVLFYRRNGGSLRGWRPKGLAKFKV